MRSYLSKLRTWLTPLRALIVGLVLVLVITVTLRWITPDQPKSGEVLIVPSITTQATPLPRSIQFIEEYPQIEVPNEFTVTTFAVRQRTLAEIAKIFGISTSQTSGSISSSDGQISLTADPNQNRILYIYTPGDHFDITSVTKLQKDKAIAAGLRFVTDQLGFQETVARTDQIQYYAIDQLYLDPVENEQTANVISIPFEYAIGNGSGRVGSSSFPPILVYVDSALQVRKAEFFPAVFSSPQTKQIRSISPSEALKQASLATVEQFYRENDSKIPLQTVKRVTIKTVNIEYRVHPITGISIPQYRFEGEAQGTTGQVATLSFLIPAVKIQFEQ